MLYYRPQRSWGKVIFSVACAKNSVQGWGVPGQVPAWQVHPLVGTPPGRYTPCSRYTPGQVHSLWQVHPPGQVPPPWAGTPPGQVHPPSGPPPGKYMPLGRYTPRAGTSPAQVHPLGRYTPRQVPPWAGTPHRQVPLTPPLPHQILWDTVNEWAVRILLECILVYQQFLRSRQRQSHRQSLRLHQWWRKHKCREWVLIHSWHLMQMQKICMNTIRCCQRANLLYLTHMQRLRVNKASNFLNSCAVFFKHFKYLTLPGCPQPKRSGRYPRRSFWWRRLIS